MDWVWWSIFIVTFAWMEWAAWFLHKYVMHGFLWNLHYDHHVQDKNKTFQKNDSFAIFFAVPSFLFILFDSIFNLPTLGAIGFGIMAYGFIYFFVHEVIIHRRMKFLSLKRNRYVQGLVAAHRDHHAIRVKEGGRCFGMLIVPLEYFRSKRAKIL